MHFRSLSEAVVELERDPISNNSTSCGDAAALAGGVGMTLAGAALLAFSMVMQRYALSYPADRIPVFCLHLPKDIVWFSGLIIYGAANALKIIAQPFGPWSVLSSVWTLLLVFNLILARCLLAETITRAKFVGSCVVIGGAVLCMLGTPAAGGCDGVQTQFSSEQFSNLLIQPAGLMWLVLLVGIVLGSVIAIVNFERRYPLPPPLVASTAPKEPSLKKVGMSRQDSAGDTAEAADGAATTASAPKFATAPPAGLNQFMAILYPLSLGLDEGVADLLIKGWASMLAVCGDTGEGCSHPILYIAIGCWVLSAFASALWWMRRVFARFEVSVALPIEYGGLNAANVLTGLLFYREYERMTPSEIGLVTSGCIVILAGIAVGLSDFACCAETLATKARAAGKPIV